MGNSALSLLYRSNNQYLARYLGVPWLPFDSNVTATRVLLSIVPLLGGQPRVVQQRVFPTQCSRGNTYRGLAQRWNGPAWSAQSWAIRRAPASGWQRYGGHHAPEYP